MPIKKHSTPAEMQEVVERVRNTRGYQDAGAINARPSRIRAREGENIIEFTNRHAAEINMASMVSNNRAANESRPGKSYGKSASSD